MRVFLLSLIGLGIIDFVSLFVKEVQLVNIAMIHLIPILYAAVRSDWKETLLVSIAAVISFNYFFLSPKYTFFVYDSRYWISFLMMIAVGQLVSWLSLQAAIAKEIEASERIQETLIGSLSHELRTPLSAIKGASSGLLSHELVLTEEDKSDLYMAIDQGAERMQRLIDNLLDTARIRSGMLQLKLGECDVSELLSSALSKAERMFPATLLIDPDIAPIRGDAVLIELALYNLLDNAFKYGDSVNIKLYNDPEGVAVKICNTGSVPSSSEAFRAWKPFERLSNVGSKEGVGLGLYVAHSIAQMHEGTVETTSDGVEFCATIRFSRGLKT